MLIKFLLLHGWNVSSKNDLKVQVTRAAKDDNCRLFKEFAKGELGRIKRVTKKTLNHWPFGLKKIQNKLQTTRTVSYHFVQMPKTDLHNAMAISKCISSVSVPSSANPNHTDRFSQSVILLCIMPDKLTEFEEDILVQYLKYFVMSTHMKANILNHISIALWNLMLTSE